MNQQTDKEGLEAFEKYWEDFPRSDDPKIETLYKAHHRKSFLAGRASRDEEIRECDDTFNTLSLALADNESQYQELLTHARTMYRALIDLEKRVVQIEGQTVSDDDKLSLIAERARQTRANLPKELRKELIK